MTRSILSFIFIFILVTSIFTQNVVGQLASNTSQSIHMVSDDFQSMTSIAYLEVGMSPESQVVQVGEEIFLALYVSTYVDEAWIIGQGPSGTFSDNLAGYTSGETYLTYKVGIAEEKDIGTWRVKFEACFYYPVYDYDGEDHHNGHGEYWLPYCDAAYATFDVVPGPSPDLVLDVTPSKSTIPVGDILNVDLNLKNQGDGTALDIKIAHASDSFNLIPGGLRSQTSNNTRDSDCTSLAPGESCDTKTYRFNTVGPVGEGNITFTVSYTDEKGKQYERIKTINLNITVGIQFVISDFFETESFNDYYSKLLESQYPFQNEVEVTLLGAEEIDSVYLIMTGLAEDRITLENMGDARYRAKFVPPNRFSESEMKDLTWMIIMDMARYKGVELPSPSWVWKQPQLPVIRVEEIVVNLKDGTEIRKEVRRALPTATDILQMNLPRWTESGTIIVAMSEQDKPPVDLLVTNPEGLKVGSNYEDNKFTSLINEVVGSLYSGRDTGLQVIRMPTTAGEYRVKATGKGSGVMDLMILSLAGEHGNVRVRRSINIDEGQSLEFKTSISEEGIVEEVEDVGLFSWFKLDQFWPILVIPIIVIVVIFLVFKMRGKTQKATRVQHKAPPPTMPEEIDG